MDFKDAVLSDKKLVPKGLIPLTCQSQNNEMLEVKTKPVFVRTLERWEGGRVSVTVDR